MLGTSGQYPNVQLFESWPNTAFEEASSDRSGKSAYVKLTGKPNPDLCITGGEAGGPDDDLQPLFEEYYNRAGMPAGDAQRTWFPEMVDVLRARWPGELSFEQLIALAAELDRMLQRIRSQRQVRTLVIRCHRCGDSGPAAAPDVTVRALILSLSRFGIVPTEQVKSLEKGWAAHRKRNGLDLYGNAAEPAAGGTTACVHPGGR